MVDAVKELAGKVAIVTGSARNIGRATAVELARAGASVTVAARSAGDLCREVVAEIEADGGRAIGHVGDITDPAQAQALVDATVAAFGGVDILILNAAVRSNTHFDELTWEEWRKVMDIDLDASFRLVKASLPHMKTRGGGSIVSLDGMAIYRGVVGRAHVSAAKAGLGGFMRGLSQDLAQYQIRCNNMVVGSFDTVRTGSSSPKSSLPSNLAVPLGRKGTPQDMANLIRFVVGPGASYITGQTIHCNGGAYFGM